MHYANCNRCHGPLDPGFRFCKTCGLDQANPFANVQMPHPQQPADTDEKQALKMLLLVLAVRYGSMLLNSAIYYFVRWTGMGYGVTSITGRLILYGYIITLLVFAIKTRHKMARLILWIMFGIELFYVLIGFLDYTPFTYMNF